MKLTKSNENYIAVLMLGVAVCFAFFAISATAVHAEEDTTEVEETIEVYDESEDEETSDEEDETSEDGEGKKHGHDKDGDEEKRAKMKEQIESLRAIIAGKKTNVKEEKKEMIETRRTDHKLDKQEFMASIEGLSEEDRRVAMLDFIADIKTKIAEFKTAQEAMKAELKADRHEIRDVLHKDLGGQTRQEKIDTILARVAELKAKIAAQEEEEHDHDSHEHDDEEEVDEESEDEEEEETDDESETDDEEETDDSIE